MFYYIFIKINKIKREEVEKRHSAHHVCPLFHTVATFSFEFQICCSTYIRDKIYIMYTFSNQRERNTIL